MTRSYYYLVASLPGLPPVGAPPLTRTSFRALCAEHLDSRDLEELEAVLAGAGRSRFALRLGAFERLLKNACARERARRKGIDPSAYLQPQSELDLKLERDVARAFAAEHPLARELALDQLRIARWREESFSAPFGLETVLAYALELDLLQRRAERAGDAGRAALLRQVDEVLAAFAERQRTKNEEQR
ncbi:MAG: DUF2764 family protein [Planctomycetes bacterium]|nr:DUF2764 family protein [Planctomycetota bacterium]